MKTKKLLALVAASLSLVSCGKKPGPQDEVKYEREQEDAIYEKHLGDYGEKAAAAKAVSDDDERLVRYAEAEAELLGKAVFMPYSTEGGSYAITRVAPRTIPYAKWGNDADRLKSMVIVDGTGFIKTAERAEMIEQWEKARAGEGTYDPVAYLTAKGYSLKNTYKTTFSTEPATLDIVNTSEQSDTEILVNCVDGLIEYDQYGVAQGNIATSWEHEEAGGKQTWTFHLRNDAKWTTADGQVYASVTADDFVAAFQHMLDTQAGLEFLVDGIVEGAHEYINAETTRFDEVGIRAVDEHTLQFTLCQPESYFPTRLAYSCFMPMNRQFFLSKGGAFGVEEFKTASASESYTYGQFTDISSQIYCGAYIPAAQFDKTDIKLKKNPNYHLPETVRIQEIEWVYDNGENIQQTYNDVKNGVYAGISLSASAGTLEWAKQDDLFNDYHYITDTSTTTYLLGINLNRGTFGLDGGACASSQSEQEKINTHTALQNIDFRRAIFNAWNRVAWNAVTRGEDMAATNLRNCYTDPNFLSLGKDVTYEGKTFTKGMTYGELIQYFGDKAGLGVNFADGQDGWYNETKAKENMQKAVATEELAPIFANGGKVKLDVVYYSPSTTQQAQASAFEKSIEAVLGEWVDVSLIEATTSAEFYACGYRAPDGKSGNFDLFYGSGWGPDYGDPSTYLDTFLGDGAGYMTKIIGLY